nr:putative nucleic acid-binding protein [Mucilaginibacter sp. FT3.2]
MLKLTRLSSLELDELEFLITRNITFINENLISVKTIIATEKVLTYIDLNDTPFVALAKHIGAKLWTGDKELMIGLKPKQFIDTLTTAELSDLLDKLERD